MSYRQSPRQRLNRTDYRPRRRQLSLQVTCKEDCCASLRHDSSLQKNGEQSADDSAIIDTSTSHKAACHVYRPYLHSVELYLIDNSTKTSHCILSYNKWYDSVIYEGSNASNGCCDECSLWDCSNLSFDSQEWSLLNRPMQEFPSERQSCLCTIINRCLNDGQESDTCNISSASTSDKACQILLGVSQEKSTDSTRNLCKSLSTAQQTDAWLQPLCTPIHAVRPARCESSCSPRTRGGIPFSKNGNAKFCHKRTSRESKGSVVSEHSEDVDFSSKLNVRCQDSKGDSVCFEPDIGVSHTEPQRDLAMSDVSQGDHRVDLSTPIKSILKNSRSVSEVRLHAARTGAHDRPARRPDAPRERTLRGIPRRQAVRNNTSQTKQLGTAGSRPWPPSRQDAESPTPGRASQPGDASAASDQRLCREDTSSINARSETQRTRNRSAESVLQPPNRTADRTDIGRRDGSRRARRTPDGRCDPRGGPAIRFSIREDNGGPPLYLRHFGRRRRRSEQLCFGINLPAGVGAWPNRIVESWRERRLTVRVVGDRKWPLVTAEFDARGLGTPPGSLPSPSHRSATSPASPASTSASRALGKCPEASGHRLSAFLVCRGCGLVVPRSERRSAASEESACDDTTACVPDLVMSSREATAAAAPGKTEGLETEGGGSSEDSLQRLYRLMDRLEARGLPGRVSEQLRRIQERMRRHRAQCLARPRNPTPLKRRPAPLGRGCTARRMKQETSNAELRAETDASALERERRGR